MSANVDDPVERAHPQRAETADAFAGLFDGGPCAQAKSKPEQSASQQPPVAAAAEIKSQAQVPDAGTASGSAEHAGVELHNQFLSVVPVQGFIDAVGGGKPEVLLKRMVEAVRKEPD